jgi:ectoine hydroxylase-related dioxygenase (phytanoyl-CoA dioxygenase family)
MAATLMNSGDNVLTARQRADYAERGFHFPLRALSAARAAELRRKFDDYWADNREELLTKLPRDRYLALVDTHFFLRWVYEIAAHPDILDAVESVLGPDILVWNTHWFPKFAHDASYVSWHQDVAYWGLTPPNVTTAWVALSTSICANGCLRVISGTHRGRVRPHAETYAAANMLSRGQEISVDPDESGKVDIELRPGEFSLHHVGIVHGSGPNDSDDARIGLAIRYISPDVIQQGGQRDLVMQLRGTDAFGHFDIVDRPERDVPRRESAVHAESIRRKAENQSLGKRSAAGQTS